MSKKSEKRWKEIVEEGHVQYMRTFDSGKARALFVGTKDKKHVDYIAFRFLDWDSDLIHQDLFFRKLPTLVCEEEKANLECAQDVENCLYVNQSITILERTRDATHLDDSTRKNKVDAHASKQPGL